MKDGFHGFPYDETLSVGEYVKPIKEYFTRLKGTHHWLGKITRVEDRANHSNNPLAYISLPNGMELQVDFYWLERASKEEMLVEIL